ncbi:response regulator [bacterium]|nr:response regulator [bacterium]
MKILLVEDDELMRDSLERLLLINKHSVECAADGQIALQILEKAKFELMITDLLMPEFSGHQLIKLCREKFPDLPIIAMTGYLEEIGKLDKDDNKPDYFLQKPFKLDELEKIIKSLKKS